MQQISMRKATDRTQLSEREQGERKEVWELGLRKNWPWVKATSLAAPLWVWCGP